MSVFFIIAPAMVAAAGLHATRPWLRNAILRRVPGPRAIMQALTSSNARQAFSQSTDHWAPYPGSGGRQIPILDRQRTPLVPEQVQPSGRYAKWWESPIIYRALRDAVKAALPAAGRSDEDWRCVIFRWSQETLWGADPIFNWNLGNIHGKPWATVSSILAGYVWTSLAEPVGMCVVNDNHQIVCEYSFGDMVTWLRYEKGWYIRNGYQAVIDGHVQGGLNGLLAASAASMARGYAEGTTAAEDALAVKTFWGAPGFERIFSGLHVLGSEWTR